MILHACAHSSPEDPWSFLSVSFDSASITFDRLSNHDIHLYPLLVTFEVDLLDKRESEFTVDDKVDIVGTLKIGGSTLAVSLSVSARMFNTLSPLP